MKQIEFKKCLLVCALSLLTWGRTFAQQPVNVQGSDSLVHNSIHQDLLADQVNITKEIKLLDSIAFAYQLQEELELYPAFELYDDVWDSANINPYTAHHVAVPDSFVMDVSNHAMPANFTRVTSKYGWRRGRMHSGMDLDIQTGDTIYAAFSGKVRIHSYQRNGYGYFLVLRHSNGLETLYAHCSKLLAEKDQLVKVGEPIALGGNTGRSFGSHLHFEVRFMGSTLNPEEVFDFTNRVAHTDQYTYMSETLKRGKRLKALSGGAKFATHRVKSGDTLSRIAQHYQVSVSEICRLNRISRTTTLRIGKVLLLE